MGQAEGRAGIASISRHKARGGHILRCHSPWRPALPLSSPHSRRGRFPGAGGRPPAPRRGPAAGPAPPSPPAPLTQPREGGGENGGRGARRGCARCCLASPHLRRCPPGERHQRGVLGVMRRPWLGLVESSACSCWSGVKQTRTCAGMLFLHPLISHRCTFSILNLMTRKQVLACHLILRL